MGNNTSKSQEEATECKPSAGLTAILPTTAKTTSKTSAQEAAQMTAGHANQGAGQEKD